MGGRGSGRGYRWDKKSTTESQHSIDIRWLKKHKYLRPGSAGSLSWSNRGKQTGSIAYKMEADRMILNYRNRPRGGEWEDVEQAISFDRTPCNYGGHRKWFLCLRCQRRVAVLYGAGKYFLCRHCHGLIYVSQQEGRLFRLMTKAQNIHMRLGGDGCLDGYFLVKPKNMHWKTYRRLYEKGETASKLASRMVVQRFGQPYW